LERKGKAEKASFLVLWDALYNSSQMRRLASLLSKFKQNHAPQLTINLLVGLKYIAKGQRRRYRFIALQGMNGHKV